MGKCRKILSTVVAVFMLLSVLLPCMVSANPCCIADISSIIEEDGKVKIQYYVSTNPAEPDANREYQISVVRSYDGRAVFVENFNTQEHGYSGCLEIDNSQFIKGEEYTVTISFCDFCSVGLCDWHTKTFTSTNGLELFDVEDLPDGMLDLIGGESVYVRVKATTSGIYNFNIADGNNGVEVYDYTDDCKLQNQSYKYYDEEEENLFMLSAPSGVEEPINATVTFTKKSFIQIPFSNDKFVINSATGMYEINVTKAGVYTFKTDREFSFLDKELSSVTRVDMSFTGEVYLKTGIYYVDAYSYDGGQNIEIAYKELESFVFGETTINAGDNFFKLDLHNSAKLTLDTLENEVWVHIYTEKENIELSAYTTETLLFDGEYVICLCLNGATGDTGKIKLTKEDITGAVLGEETGPVMEREYNGNIFAFCASEAGRYIFHFPDTDYMEKKFSTKESNLSDYNQFCELELQENEWVFITTRADSMTVNKYTDPTPTVLTQGVENTESIRSGETKVYSFEAPQKDMYKLKWSGYEYEMKIYTEDETLYDSNQTIINSNFLNVELDKDETVFVAVCVYNQTRDFTITADALYEQIDADTSITLSPNEEFSGSYTVDEAGYYDVNIARIESVRLLLKVNDMTRYINSYTQTVTEMVYANAGEKINITLQYQSGYTEADITINIGKTPFSSMTLNTEVEAEADEKFLFNRTESALYCVSAQKTSSNGSSSGSGSLAGGGSASGGGGAVGGGSSSGMDAVNINVSSPESNWLAFLIDGKTYFVGEANTEYIISPREAAKLKIEKVSTDEFGAGVMKVSQSENTFLKFNVAEAGMYRSTANMTNTEAYIFNDNNWDMISNGNNGIFKFDEGAKYVLMLPYKRNGIITPYGELTFNKGTKQSVTEIEIADAKFYPVYNTIVKLNLTLSVDDGEYRAGIEYKDENGIWQACEMESYLPVYNIDECEVKLTHIEELELSKTYTVRPYIIKDESGSEKIYGSEKTITIQKTDDIIKLTDKKTTVDVNNKTTDKATPNIYTFLYEHPENSVNNVIINHPDYLMNLEVADEENSYLYPEYSQETGELYYKLEGGKKYYFTLIATATGKADIEITDLVETYKIESAKVLGNTISFDVYGSGVKKTAVYGALYSDKGELIEVKKIKNPGIGEVMTYTKLSEADSIKLILLDEETQKPLCNFVTPEQ